MLEDPQKFLMTIFINSLKKKTTKLAFLDLANSKRNKIRNFGYVTSVLVTVADGSMVGRP